MDHNQVQKKILSLIESQQKAFRGFIHDLASDVHVQNFYATALERSIDDPKQKKHLEQLVASLHASTTRLQAMRSFLTQLDGRQDNVDLDEFLSGFCQWVAWRYRADQSLTLEQDTGEPPAAVEIKVSAGLLFYVMVELIDSLFLAQKQVNQAWHYKINLAVTCGDAQCKITLSNPGLPLSQQALKLASLDLYLQPYGATVATCSTDDGLVASAEIHLPISV